MTDLFLLFAPIAVAVAMAAGALSTAVARKHRTIPVPVDRAETQITIAAAMTLVHPGGVK